MLQILASSSQQITRDLKWRDVGFIVFKSNGSIHCADMKNKRLWILLLNLDNVHFNVMGYLDDNDALPKSVHYDDELPDEINDLVRQEQGKSMILQMHNLCSNINAANLFHIQLCR